MNGQEKSDPVIVARRPTNEAERSGSEPAEPRTGAEGNAGQHSTRRAQDRESVSQALTRIRQAAGQRRTSSGSRTGFRPGRGTHDALDALAVGITSKKVNFILDADIRSFFDEVSRERLIGFVEHRIGDPRIIRLIEKWLKAGVLEDGVVTDSDRGTGQGTAISPLLANIYLHYVFDLWAERWRRREATGDMIIVRYADDIIVGFEHEDDARRFLEAMRERLDKFALSLHPDKTRLIEFGRFAANRRAQRGLGKASTSSAGELQVPRLHPHLRQVPTGLLPPQAEVPERPHAGETASHQTGTAAAHASADTRPGKMAGAGRQRLVQLSRRADQRSRALRLTLLRHRPLAANAQAAQPKGWHDLGANHAPGRRLAAQTENPSPLASTALRRQTPKMGAVCPNWARTDLCGGAQNARPLYVASVRQMIISAG